MRFLLAILLVAGTVLTAEAKQIPGKRGELLRKMLGTYYGSAPGTVIVEGQSSQYQITYLNLLPEDIRGKNTRILTSPTGRPFYYHTIRPRVHRNRAKFKGVYFGSFVNPDNDTLESYSGTDSFTVVKRGTHYTLHLKQLLREGTLSYTYYSGTLFKSGRR